MSVHDEVLATFGNLDNFVLDCLNEFDAELEKEMLWVTYVQKDIEEFERTGVLPQIIGGMSRNESEMEPEVEQHAANTDNEQIQVASSSSSSLKENGVSNCESLNSTSQRITRHAKNLFLSNMQQQHDNLMNKLDNVQIKIERTSKHVKNGALQLASDIKVKEEMPPPKVPLGRNRRNKKGTDSSVKVKSEVLDEVFKNNTYLHLNRDSDVQIQKDSLLTIVLDDSILENKLEPIRKTRARTKVEKKDVESVDESQREIEDKTGAARTKRNKDKDKKIEENRMNKTEDHNKSRRTRSTSRNVDNEQLNIDENEKPQHKKRKIELDHLDVLAGTPIVTEQPNKILNETLIISKPCILDTTVVIKKPTLEKEITTLNNIMTDDEDVVGDSPATSKQQKTVKPVFSPYDNSPVKKRVEAFEKLGVTADTASKVIRSKIGNQLLVDKDITKTFSGQKSRLFGTPLMENRLRHLQTSSASKCLSNIPIPSSSSFLTASKTGSGMKTSASLMEFRERELRRKQKEADALQKKEAKILALTEEKRKKREEREMKVQQSKKTKDEKFKQMLAEKEAKLMQQKEEAAKTRAAAAKKVAETKNNEGLKPKFIPPYLKYDTPLLPSPDCYDSDDSSTKHRVRTPKWQKKPLLFQTHMMMLHSGPLRKKFFLSGPRTPNLQDIFPTIEPSKLKRTSSAIWNKTEKSMLENMTEEDDDY